METQNPDWMHEVHFYLKKNKETGSLEISVERAQFFRPKKLFSIRNPRSRNQAKTLRIAQDVAYLKFRYYYEISEKGNSSSPTDEKSVKVSGEWTDKIITEPFDFKSSIGDNNSTGDKQEPVRIPKAVEFSVGFLKPGLSGEEPEMVELPPTILPIQTGMVFERFKDAEEASDEPKE